DDAPVIRVRPPVDVLDEAVAPLRVHVDEARGAFGGIEGQLDDALPDRRLLHRAEERPADAVALKVRFHAELPEGRRVRPVVPGRSLRPFPRLEGDGADDPAVLNGDK